MNYFYDYYIDIFKSKYIKFNGRASRSEFWYFALFNILVSVLLFVADIALGTTHTVETANATETIGYLSSAYNIFVFIPSLALTFRRLHDIGKSAWWLFVFLIPLIGLFVILYFYVKAGDEGDNKYGSATQEPNDSHIQRGKSEIMERRTEGSTGKKIFKIIGITLIVLFVLAGVLFFFMGGALLSIGNAIVEEANSQVTSQQITQGGDEILITIPIKEKYELLYKDVSLCTPESAKDIMSFSNVAVEGFNVGTSCVNGQCKISVSLKDKSNYPKEILAYTNESGECKQKSIPTTNKPSIGKYEVLLEMTPDILNRLGIASSDYKATVSKTGNYSSFQLGGTKKISFYYSEKVDSDDLLIDGEKRAKLLYSKAQEGIKTIAESQTKPMNPKTSQEVKTITDEDKLKALKEELKELKKKRKELMLQKSQ